MTQPIQGPRDNPFVRRFSSLRMADIPLVGAKNAGLGELTTALPGVGIPVPGGFALTAPAYRAFVEANNLHNPICLHLDAWQRGETTLPESGKAIRRLFLAATLPPEITTAVRRAYHELSAHYQTFDVDVAVRSSATSEEPPTPGYAGLEETFLNVRGEQELLEACRKCYASLFTDRAISYRTDHGIDHWELALSIGVQKMVRSDLAGAGMIFTLDPETGFPCLVLITAAWGLGTSVELGAVQPDEYEVFTPVLRQGLCPIIAKRLGGKAHRVVYGTDGGKSVKTVDTATKDRHAFVLTDEEILQLAGWAVTIEDHFDRAVEIEWAKDGQTGDLFIVQARPEAVRPRRAAAGRRTFTLNERRDPLLTGQAVGDAVVAGQACLIKHASDGERFVDGAILVTGMTDPDWMPIMKRAAAIVTDFGGRTSHAAMVSRDLGIPAVVGAAHATATLHDFQVVTLSCAEGAQGRVYAGRLDFEATAVNLEKIPETRTRIMMTIADPDVALRWWRPRCHGIGLVPLEFLISNVITVHPLALVHFDRLTDPGARKQIQALTRGYADKTEYFVERLARGIAKIAASQHPHPVIVRMSDFTTNEYADLIGGKQFESAEANPILGRRGASRYYSDGYREGFALECKAIKRVREHMGLANVIVMIPFCRTLKEADLVLAEMAKNGLTRDEQGPRIYVTCEIPSNVILAEGFAARFDGFSIDGHDLTRLVLGVDQDSARPTQPFDERDEAVKWMIRRVVDSAHAAGRTVDFQGQVPGDYRDFAAFLVEAGIDSITLNPESVIPMKRRIAELEHTSARSLASAGRA